MSNISKPLSITALSVAVMIVGAAAIDTFNNDLNRPRDNDEIFPENAKEDKHGKELSREANQLCDDWAASTYCGYQHGQDIEEILQNCTLESDTYGTQDYTVKIGAQYEEILCQAEGNQGKKMKVDWFPLGL